MLTHNPRYLVVGASSETGKALVQYLSDTGKIYSISDTKTNFFQELFFEKLKTQPIDVYDEPIQSNNQLEDIGHILIAPGVPRAIPLLQEAQKRRIPIDSEIAFTLNILKQENRTPIILGITGSLGKSTTSFLIFQILQKGYQKGNSYLLGNFGTPLISKIKELSPKDIVVLELSSYQLEDAEKYSVHGATILNVTPNHLDRYESFLDYQKTKEKIFLNQTQNDFSILNMNLPQAQHFQNIISSKIIRISTIFQKNYIFSMDSHNIYHYQDVFLEQKNLKLKSSHIVENMCVALAFTTELAIPKKIQLQVLKEFKGLEHRSEWVGEIHNIQFINDSKATTPFAIIPNLDNPEYGKIVLILGGKNKNLDFLLLNEHLQYVKYIVFYGFSGVELQNMVKFADSDYVYNFKEAVLLAYRKAQENQAQTVLLSPGCTSFDQFVSYQHRGTEFKKIVNELT